MSLLRRLQDHLYDKKLLFICDTALAMDDYEFESFERITDVDTLYKNLRIKELGGERRKIGNG